MNREQAEKAARAGAKVRRDCWGPGEWMTFKGSEIVDNYGCKYGSVFDFAQGGWSIVSPAPTAEPDLAEQVAALAARMDRFEREHTTLTDSERDAFMAALETATDPTPALRKALAAYRANTKPVTRAEFDALAEEFHRHFHMTDPREDRTTTQYQPPEHGWPTPNAATREALDDLAAGRVTTFDTVEALMADLEGPEVMSDDEIIRAGYVHGDVNASMANAINLTRASVIAEIEAARKSKLGSARAYQGFDCDRAVDAAIDHILKAVRK